MMNDSRRQCLRYTFAATALVVGIAGIIIGGVLPAVVTKNFPTVIQNSIVINGNRLWQSPQISSSFVANSGTSFSAGDDNGKNYNYYLVNISNVDDVLTNAAKPIVSQVGPMPYRVYTQSVATVPDSYGVETWYERDAAYYETGIAAAGLKNYPSDLKTKYVTMPNIGWSALVTQIKPIGLLVGLNLNYFEQVGIPIFASSGLLGIVNQLNAQLPVLLAPIGFGGLFQGDVIAYMTIMSVDQPTATGMVLADFVNASRASPMGPANVLRAPAALLDMSLAVAASLFTPSSAFAIDGAGGWGALSAVLAAIATNPAGEPAAFGAAVVAFTTAMAPLDSTYVTVPGKAVNHVLGLLAFVGPFVTPGAPQLTALTSAITNVLIGTGLLPPGSTIADVVPSILGENAPFGLAVAEAAGYVYDPALGYPSAGATVMNTCPAFASLADIPAIAAGLGGTPEFSCWNARINPVSLGTRMNATLMGRLITAVTTGNGILTPPGVPAGPLAGTSASAAFVGGAAALQAAITAMLSGGPFNAGAAFVLQTANAYGGVQVAAAAYAASPNATTAAALHSAQLAHQAIMTSSYSCAFDVLGLGVNCAQLADAAGWLNYIAQVIVFETQFMRKGPVVYNVTSGTFGPHPDPYYASLMNETNPLRAGPFIKCTLYELMEIGCHDNFLDFFNLLSSNGLKPPGSPAARITALGPAPYFNPTPAGDAAWAAALTAGYGQQTLASRFTGEADISTIDQIRMFNGAATYTNWFGEIGSTNFSTPVTGSYDSLQFSPTLSLHTDYSAAPATQLAWIPQIARPVKVFYDSSVTDPSGNVQLWRFVLPKTSTNIAASLPWYNTDAAAVNASYGLPALPRCGVNVANKYAGAQLVVGKPFLVGCEPFYSASDDMVFAAGFPTPTDATHGSYLDIEPITGLVMNGMKRVGGHLRVGPSPWFNVRSAIIFTHTGEQSGSVDPAAAKSFQTSIAIARSITSSIVPAVCFTLGCLLFITGIVLFVSAGRKSSPKTIPTDDSAVVV